MKKGNFMKKTIVVNRLLMKKTDERVNLIPECKASSTTVIFNTSDR
jgi:hypothetical protein